MDATTRDRYLELADGYEHLAEVCRAKAEEFGEAVVAAIESGCTKHAVNTHNAQMEHRLHGDANMYQTYANSFQALYEGRRPGLLPPPSGASSVVREYVPDPDLDRFGGSRYQQLGMTRTGYAR